MRYAPGLSLRYGAVLPDQIGLAVDAGELDAVTLWSDDRDLTFLDYLPSRLPYLLTMPENVLVLEPQAGLPVLGALWYGARNVAAVDSNPLVIDTVRELTAGCRCRSMPRTRTPGSAGRGCSAARTGST